MKNKISNTLEKTSKTMVQPLIYLPVIGILMVFGVLITNNTITGLLPILQWGPVQFLGNLLYSGMMTIINNLAILFVVGIAAALAKKEKHHAAIIAFLSYFVFLTANNLILESLGKLAEADPMLGLFGSGQANVLGVQVLDTGVFGGIILGFISGYVYNKTSDKQFDKSWLNIFGGQNWTVVWLSLISITLGVLTVFVWPPIQSVILSVTSLISETGNVGLFFYGFLERILVPTGLHHLIYAPFQFGELGGSLQMGEQVITGAYPIYMTEVSNPNLVELSANIRWMQTAFTKTFGYIGIAAAFVKTAKPENKNKIKAMLIPLVITSFMVSITEPIDFLFAFAAPILFLLHAVISGSFMVILNVLEIRAATSGLSGIILNLALGSEITKWPLMMLIALTQILLYYFLFSFLIKKMNLNTPGRESNEELRSIMAEPETSKTSETGTVSPKTETVPSNQVINEQIIIEALGGRQNIISVDNCFTRLRVEVENPNKISRKTIDKQEHSGVFMDGSNIQIIYGLGVGEIANKIKNILKV